MLGSLHRVIASLIIVLFVSLDSSWPENVPENLPGYIRSLLNIVVLNSLFRLV